MSMTEGDILLESIQAIKVAKGDILLVEVSEHVHQAHLRAFRRELGERLKEAGFSRKDVCSIVVQKGTVEITRITTDHIKAMERRIDELEAKLSGLSSRVGCIMNTGFDPEEVGDDHSRD